MKSVVSISAGLVLVVVGAAVVVPPVDFLPVGPRSVGAAEPDVVWGLQLVLRHVAERKYALPKGDFILLSYQPMGIVSETIVYDFDVGVIVRIPGTHDDEVPIFRMPFSKEKARLLRDVVALEGVKSLSRESGNVGLDGATTAAIIKIDKREQRIDQWQGDAPGLELLDAIRDHEVMTVGHEINRRENAKRRAEERQ
jgi:hypothetical protein